MTLGQKRVVPGEGGTVVRVPKRIGKAMYGLQEFCKGVERCLVGCPHCSEADFCTITIDGKNPAQWGISKEHIDRLEEI